jgi:hypothetical protein
MYERASIHGVSVEVRTQPGAGTRVEIIVPMPDPPATQQPEPQIGPPVRLGR